ncbi:hypothetical protein ALQ37_102622 [Pseudomonas syringae pv. aptata]|uniref:Uncharacterized protein n=1 Tax=Pseudomonas syringae pv. aptata TaxID=83167 RepID=A0A0Q0IP17_PSEAP|nr:hypothetical protein ALO85_101887 [Pseudomonas syringae pv. aptata]RMO47955.1 hypothetical protein ALQ40_101841 [Pseudomonas syringae]RMO58284.1 hypothetical protein ALQ37_102622 [Pseudomonas syringae pv. aptata]RMU59786.1 hypothetical protein ALP25_102137 [Pseudomonas syringae pv. syringae]
MSAYLHLSYLGFRAASCRPQTVMCSKRQAASRKSLVVICFSLEA